MTKYDVFISYRRLNSYGKVEGRDIARLIATELKVRGINVFFDYTEIRDNDFIESILPAIHSCKIFILVLTPNALERCNNEGDWVRREIIEAHRLEKKIIIINPDGKFNSFPNDMPEDLRFLSTIQMSVVDMNSNFEVTLMKMFKDRIQILLDVEKYEQACMTEDEEIRFSLSGKTFIVQSEFMSKEVYNALKRAYK